MTESATEIKIGMVLRDAKEFKKTGRSRFVEVTTPCTAVLFGRKLKDWECISKWEGAEKGRRVHILDENLSNPSKFTVMTEADK